MTTNVTREQLEEMRRTLANAEADFTKGRQARQRAAMSSLVRIKDEINALVNEATAIADSVDLTFYFSSGYDEFTWCDRDEWNSSSANC